MSKFMKLVKNEYLKVLLKISTWIMLILVVLTALGLNVLSAVSKHQQQQYESSYNEMEMIKNDLSYYENAKPEGYEQQVERLRMMIEYEVGYDSWQNLALEDYVQSQSELEMLQQQNASAEEIKNLKAKSELYKKQVAENDWRGYYSTKLQEIRADQSLSQKEKEQKSWEYQYRLENDLVMDSTNWKSNLVLQISGLKEEILSMELQKEQGQQISAEDLQKAEEKMQIGLYRLEHDIKVNTADNGGINLWSTLDMSVSAISIISMLIIVIAGSSVANEFSNGTIKFLLINPVKRGKILVSKYITVITFSYIILAVFYVMNILFGVLFHGAGDLFAPYLYVRDGAVKEISSFLSLGKDYLLGSISIVVMATLAFAISSLVRSAALAIGVGMFAMLAGNSITVILKEMLNLDWSRYLIFANLDLNQIMEGNSMYANHTPAFAFIVIAVYMVVFLLTAWDGFTRREV